MTAKTAMLDDDYLASGATAASSALSKVRALADAAPRRSVFAAISTLTDLSSRIETSLVASSEALDTGHTGTAAFELTRATVLMHSLSAEAKREEPCAPPAYLRKRRFQSDL